MNTMPTKGFDSNSPFYAIIDEDGNICSNPFVSVTQVVEGDDAKERYTIGTELTEPAEMTFVFKVRNVRGMFDCLIGRRWTNAARRYIRTNKRMKEKKRRQKLKGEDKP